MAISVATHTPAKSFHSSMAPRKRQRHGAEQESDEADSGPEEQDVETGSRSVRFSIFSTLEFRKEITQDRL